jgi:hypothetical protein
MCVYVGVMGGYVVMRMPYVDSYGAKLLEKVIEMQGILHRCHLKPD